MAGSARGPAIHELTFEALQQYDVGRLKPGTDYAKSFPDQQAVDGTRIPRLADLFDLVRKSGNATVGFDCETKISPLEPAATLPPDEFTRKVIAEIREARMQRADDGPVVRLAHAAADPERGAGNPDDVPHRRRTRSPLRTAADRPCGSPGSLPSYTGARSRSGPRRGRQDLGAQPGLSHRPCWPRRMRWASWSSRGPSTIPAMMTKLIEMGVDGIISDRPDLGPGRAQEAAVMEPTAPIADTCGGLREYYSGAAGTAHRTSGRTTPTCRSTRCASRCPAAVSR